MRNPSSFVALSVQESATELLLNGLAMAPDAAAGGAGGGGGPGVVAQAVLENAE
jgi:hypothetical protein